MCYRLGSGKKKSEFVRIQNPAHESIKRYEENVLIKKGTGTDIRAAGQKGHKKAYRTEVERSLLFHSLDSRAKAEYLEHTAGADELAGAGGTPVVMKAVRTEIHHYLHRKPVLRIPDSFWSDSDPTPVLGRKLSSKN